MRRPARLALLAAALAGCAAPPRAEPAELVVVNARVYTVDPDRPWAEAFAVRGGRFAAVGSDAEVEASIGAWTRVVDAGGRLVLPGFHDAHVHALEGGVELDDCQLVDARSAAELQELLRAFAEEHPERPWIRGAGWDQSLFPGGLPTKALLDAVVPDRPVSLAAGDGGHTLLVNSRALERAGIDRDTPDPPRGEIVRDTAGEPTGVLREAATDLIAPHLPPRTDDELDAGLRRGLAELARYGVTSFQEARAGERIAASYGRLDARGELTARVRLALHAPAEEVAEDGAGLLSRLAEAREQLGGPQLCAGSVKLFLDGVIEGRTSALLEPYVGPDGAPDAHVGCGPANFDPAPLAAFVTTLDAAGFQLHMHSIGDRAVRQGLDAIAAARAANGPRDARHHLAHVQLVDPADLARFAELGVAANIQALWAYADGYITELTEPVLGPERSRRLYPFASLRDAGAVLVGGSDWPVTSANPLEAIQVALTRKPPEDPDAPAWLPEERLALETALAAYTSNGAWLDFHEDRAGSITPGKLADFVLLERDLFTIPPEEIGAVRVLWTVFEGREVFRDDPSP